MPDPAAACILRFTGVRKPYGELRPLRIAGLTVAAGERLSISGLDAAAAETFVGLATGAMLPEEGRVEAFGRSTAAITDGQDWLDVLDRVGLVSDRMVLLTEMTVAQNLAVPFTLTIDPLDDEMRSLVERLAAEVGLQRDLDSRVVELDPAALVRVRIGRALALGPSLVILEHPSAPLPPAEARRCGRLMADLARARAMAVVALTADPSFARTLGGRRLTLQAATGALTRRSWWRWRT